MTPQATIAHYRVTAKVGEGGMGEVYRAIDTKLGREVAIKVIPPSVAADANRLARFAREAQVLASLNHPNIASIYGVEESALVMELVEGPTLEERIAGGPIPVEEARSIAEQLIDALEYAHERGVVHRDLKPANIKVTPDGRVKVLDFGLAKALATDTVSSDPLSSPTLTIRATTPGMIMGTAAYMSPEQARGQDVDKRADIWSFGVVVHEMVTGRQLFAGETVSDTIAHVLTREFDWSAVPREFEPLLARCLLRERRKRLRDIGDARWLLEQAPAAASPSTTNKGSWRWAAACCALTLIAGVFAFLWWRSTPARAAAVRFAVASDRFVHLLLSPDGQFLLQRSRPLRVRRIDGIEWKSLPDTDGARDPFWSGDSTAIGFFSDERLHFIRVDAPAATNIAAASNPQGGAWRGGVDKGTILFSSNGRLHVLDLASRKAHELALGMGSGEIASNPTFLPEGDGFVYVLQSNDQIALHRATMSSNAGERLLDTGYKVAFARHPRTSSWHMFFCDPRPGVNCDMQVSAVNARTGELEGKPERLIESVAVYASRRNAIFDVADSGIVTWRSAAANLPAWRMRWVDHHGNVAGTLGEVAQITALALSPDEEQVAVSQGYPQRQVWIYNVRKGTSARVSTVAGDERFPTWSRDGRVLYYTSRRDDRWLIMRKTMETGALPETIYEEKPGRRTAIHDATPDGEYLIVTRSAPGEKNASGIFRLKLATDAGKSSVLEPLVSNDAAAAVGLTVALSPDGKWLIYSMSDGQGLYALPYPVSGSEPRWVGRVGMPFFNRDGTILYGHDGVNMLSHRVMSSGKGDFRLGDRTVLFANLGAESAGAHVAAASRDGNRILVIATDQPEAVATQVLSDWTTLPGQNSGFR
jgi:serine/threonine protein kinase